MVVHWDLCYDENKSWLLADYRWNITLASKLYQHDLFHVDAQAI